MVKLKVSIAVLLLTSFSLQAQTEGITFTVHGVKKTKSSFISPRTLTKNDALPTGKQFRDKDLAIAQEASVITNIQLR